MGNRSGVVHPAQDSTPIAVPGKASPELEVLIHQDPAAEFPVGMVLESLAQD
jgi:hypothetical protein